MSVPTVYIYQYSLGDNKLNLVSPKECVRLSVTVCSELMLPVNQTIFVAFNANNSKTAIKATDLKFDTRVSRSQISPDMILKIYGKGAWSGSLWR